VVKYNAIVWIEAPGDKPTILSAVFVDDTGTFTAGTEYSLKHKRPYSLEELQATYPKSRVWLDKRDDATALYRADWLSIIKDVTAKRQPGR
jgi:hypothetical protein